MVEYGPLHWFKYLLPVDSYVILLTKKVCRVARRGAELSTQAARASRRAFI